MKPVKFSKTETNQINLGTKIIVKYPAPTKDFDIAKMIVNGRHPEKSNSFLLEKECSFVIYVLSGSGKVFAGEEVFEVVSEDVIFVPKGHAFAVEGKLEYITVDVPAFFPEQATFIEGKKL